MAVMTDDSYPEPVSDPEAGGLPDTADDDSTARDDVESGRVADGPDPAALPADREDGPVAVDRYGTTPEEARVGESLDQKLSREVPDPALESIGPRPDATAPSGGTETFDAEPLDTETDTVDDATVLDTAPIPANEDSPVSMYDSGVGGRETVGRLVEPDEGAPYRTEADAVATDAGAAGGGPTAEELAMHPIEE